MKEIEIKSFKKQTTIIICILLLFSALSIILLPNVNAATQTQSWALLDVSPDPVGVGQKLTVIMFANPTFPNAAVTNDIRRHDYTLTITKPDGQTQSIKWDVIQDTGNGQVYIFTPDQVGIYSFVFSFPDQVYTWNSTAAMRQYTDTVYLGDTSKTVNVTVQQDPLPDPITSYPVPSEYWTRPIEGQNTDWWRISSNWLGSPYIAGNTDHMLFQPDGLAPGSPHVMWTMRLSDGGVVGGTDLGTLGETFYQGLTYNPRFLNPIIMGGRLFFELPYDNAGSGGDYVAVDLRTGQELWRFNTTGVGVPSFGYYYALDYENQHGVMPDGELFTSNFAKAIDPRTGTIASLNITNVPTGFAAAGPKGEILRYQISLTGKWLAQWNSSRLLPLTSTNPNFITSTINASTADRYDWNITLPANIPTNTAIRYVLVDNVLFGSSSFSAFSSSGTPNPYSMWAISLKPESRGQLLFSQNYTAPPDNATRRLFAVDQVNRVILMQDKESALKLGYSLDTGNLLWQTPPSEGTSDLTYFNLGTVGLTPCTAYGRIYDSGWDGVLRCWDTKDGKLLWSYGNGGIGNSTSTNLQSSWGRYPTFIYVIADDKVYLMSSEHSPDTPMWKGAVARSVNATDGAEIWKLMSFGGQLGRYGTALADGYWVYYNYYDSRLYCIGKGPSALTVDAPMTAAILGQSVVIRGTVLDIAAGTTQQEQSARFPYGVPAVSDESQAAWMEYVYMQKPRPTDVIGVSVVLSVVDANGNYREIGTTTSDADGFYSLNWKPDIEGKFTVYANFAGSESYWPSRAVTSFAVDSAAPTLAPTSEPIQSAADMYFVPAIAGLFVLIIVVAIVLALLMLRKRT